MINELRGLEDSMSAQYEYIEERAHMKKRSKKVKGGENAKHRFPQTVGKLRLSSF